MSWLSGLFPAKPKRKAGTGYPAHVERDRRLVILRITAEGNGTANDRMLVTGLAHWGIRCTLEAVSQSLDWLEEHGLVKLRAVPDSDVRIAEITRRGRDVADGVADVPGVTPRRLVAD